jgi:hypothetical protein
MPEMAGRGFPTDFPVVGCAEGSRAQQDRRGFPTERRKVLESL